jgi:glycosyltransferase involved in cell wall biosynthesis
MSTELLVFGESSKHPVPESGLPVRNLGVISDENRIELLYRAADLFVLPSRQENFPNMVLEAMACGTPCVAFSVGGLSEMITHAETGYLARPYEAGDMAEGLNWLLADEEKRLDMAFRSRRWVEENVSMDLIVQRYLQLYRELLEEQGVVN